MHDNSESCSMNFLKKADFALIDLRFLLQPLLFFLHINSAFFLLTITLPLSADLQTLKPGLRMLKTEHRCASNRPDYKIS